MIRRGVLAAAVGVLSLRRALAVAAVTCCAGGLLADEPVGSSVRYSREIARIFERKCVPCHAAGGPAFPLASFHDVRPWTRSIREEILERRMPPFSAAPGLQPLANDASLSTREIAIVVSWADGGAPRGDPLDLPEPKQRSKWPTGEPSLVLSSTAREIPPDGKLYVRRVRLPTGLRAERWLRGFDLAPGDRSAVRAAFLFLEMPGGGEQWLGGWTPWHSMTSAPRGVAHRLPAGAVLALELHCLSSGPGGGDRSELGLYFDRTRPAAPAQSLPVLAGTGAMLAADATLWALRVEGAGSVEVVARKPDGAVEPLLWVKEVLPEWPTPYVLREPPPLPRGTRLVVTSRTAARVDAALFPNNSAGVPAADGR